MDTSTFSDDSDSGSESSARSWLCPEDCESPTQACTKTVQTLEDALADVLESDGALEYVRSDTVRISVRVPERVRASILAGKSGETPENLFFFFDVPNWQVRLEPFWESQMTLEGKLLCAIRCGLLVADSSPYFYLKPLVQWVMNDLELVGLLRCGCSGSGEPSTEAVEEVRSRVVSRLSQGSETFAGLFALEEDREQVEVVADILNAVMESYRVCRSRNVITCAFRVIQHNLDRFGEKCYLCGVGHVPPGLQTMPMPCCNSLCRFRACDMMHGQLYPFIQQHPKVFALLVELVKAASTSPRAKEIFLPMPPGTCVETITRLCKELPKLKRLTECSCENEIKSLLRAGDYKHLWWLVANIPSSVELTDFAEIEGIVAKAGDLTVVNKDSTVFRITSWTTSLHRKHLAACEKYKRYKYKYHGSPVDNWYSILKHGPRVMSKTEYQLHGCARGNGIYMAHAYQVAKGYTNAFLGNSQTKIIGICGVVDVPGSEINRSPHSWVVKTPEFVALKYLIVN